MGQEILACTDRYLPRDIFFWARDQRDSRAEVDHVVNIGTEIIPLEVKAGKTGTLKSLRLFLEEKGARFGIRISQEPLSYHDKILSIPPYMIEQMARLVKLIG